MEEISTKKGTKKRKRFHKFNMEWTEMEFCKAWLIKSKCTNLKSSNQYAFCKVCNINIFPNKIDIMRHGNSSKHIKLLDSIRNTQDLSGMLNKPHSENVRIAELKLSAAVVEANIPFSFMDLLSPLCSQIFPDSKIASDLTCKRTKTTQITKNLGILFLDDLYSMLRRPGCFFSLIMDETTDIGTVKQCAFNVIYFCSNSNKVSTRFLNMIEVTSGKAVDLYDGLKKTLSDHEIPMSNLVGFASDTTNVMIGEHQSVFSHLKADIPNIALIKCS